MTTDRSDRRQQDDAWMAGRLQPPSRVPVPVVIDTDTANEIDDQFALAWALLSPGEVQVEAVHAAPFSFAHRRAAYPAAAADAAPFCSPAEGMRRSRDEALRVFDLLGIDAAGRVFDGSERYLGADDRPVDSPAARDLIARARRSEPDAPLHVLVLGCPTNVASALRLAPDIAERIVVVWTSGYPSSAPHVNDSFNLEQDVAASQVLFDSGVPLVYLPGFQVGAQLRLSLAEVERHVAGRGAIGDALHTLFTANPLWALAPVDTTQPYSWVIWDLVCIAWVLNPQWLPSTLVRAPLLDGGRRWQHPPGRHWMREAHAVDRDAIFNDLFAKLAAQAAAPAAPAA